MYIHVYMCIHVSIYCTFISGLYGPLILGGGEGGECLCLDHKKPYPINPSWSESNLDMIEQWSGTQEVPHMAARVPPLCRSGGGGLSPYRSDGGNGGGVVLSPQ